MKSPAFHPTDAQRQLMDYVQANPGFQTVSELCCATGINPSTYYRWCQDPAFRAWFCREWSTRLLFEGWHMLNLARANMVRSPIHFRALFGLVFDPRSQAALAAWTDRCATPPEGGLGVACDVTSNQELSPENASFSKPHRVARHLRRSLALASPESQS